MATEAPRVVAASRQRCFWTAVTFSPRLAAIRLQSRSRIGRRLELVELVLRRLGCLGARERTKPVPLELQLAAIGEAVFLWFGRFISSPLS
jgi:hypothetical protein